MKVSPFVARFIFFSDRWLWIPPVHVHLQPRQFQIPWRTEEVDTWIVIPCQELVLFLFTFTQSPR